MSNMLEQAIVDAAALREAALKNAEQAIIEKYAPQIKEAVEAMLETEDLNEKHCMKGDRVKHEGVVVEVVYEEDDDGMVTVKEMGGKPYMARREEIQELNEEDILQEEEMAMAAAPAGEIQAPFAVNPSMPAGETVNFSLDVQDLGDGMVSIDLDALEKAMNVMDDAPLEDALPRDDVAAELGSDELGDLDSLLSDIDDTEGTEETEDDMDLQLQELLDLLSEDEVLEEKITVDMAEDKDGTFQTNEATLEYEQAKQEAHDAHSDEDKLEEEEDDSELKEAGKVNDLQETVSVLASQNEKLENVIYRLQEQLEATLLSNAKLIYKNRTLSDASLNERQKEKIVEAIAAAESPKEAKQLHETLKATVGSSSKKHGPQSLSESVNRRANLSAMLNSRQNLSENKSADPFMEKMQKLAGIK
jgi:hypothetical protein